MEPVYPLNVGISETGLTATQTSRKILTLTYEAIVRLLWPLKVDPEHYQTYFACNEFFCSEQFEFRSKRSCETQLLMIMEHWSRLIEDGTNIDVIYLDF